MTGRAPATGSGGGPLRHLPNLISGLRILLVAPLVLMILDGRHEAALLIALVAGVSDGIDGFLARRFHWQSRLGSILDPVADKLMLVGCMVALGWLHEAARWLVALVVARDAIIVAGALAWHRLLHNFVAEPSRLSKATTVAQIGYVLWVLADHAFGWHTRASLPGWIVGLLTLASGIDYVVRWGFRARREFKGRGTAA